MAGKGNGLPQFCRDIAKLTDGCPEAIRERYAALEALERVGEVYYKRWLNTSEILTEALEDCEEAKMYLEKAKALEAAYRKKEET